MSVVVRDIRPEEHPAVGELLVTTYADHASDRYLPELRDIAGRLADPGAAVLVAVDTDDATGAPLGTVTYVAPYGSLKVGDVPDEAGMRMLGVTTSARGRGVGAALVAACADRARADGATGIAFGTLESMRDAHRLYARLGYQRLPDRDLLLPSGRPLLTYGAPLTPWPDVRPAAVEELERIGELTVAAYAVDGFLSPGDDYAEVLRDATDRSKRADLLVAVDRTTGEPVGTVTGCPQGSAYLEIARTDEEEVRMLAVAPDARGRGVARALMHGLIARARERGARGLALSTQSTMYAAHRLYERLGFQRVPDRDWAPVPGVSLLAYTREI